MNKEKYVIDFLRVSAKIKIEKTILFKEDVKWLLNYIDKLQKENEQKQETIDKIRTKIKELEKTKKLYNFNVCNRNFRRIIRR